MNPYLIFPAVYFAGCMSGLGGYFVALVMGWAGGIGAGM